MTKTKREEQNRELLQMAIVGLTQQQAVLDAKILDIRSRLDSAAGGKAPTSEAPDRPRRKFSKATRERMKLAQQARWKRIHAAERKAGKR